MRKETISTGITRYQFDTFDDWLSGRQGIGGSDASSIVGMNPYKTNQDLWLEKTGQVDPIYISDKPYVKYGHMAEDPIRKIFELDHPEYRVFYYENNMIKNEKYQWAHASLDGELVDREGRNGVLEIKTTEILQNMQWVKWKDRIPDNYYIQVLHYLMVTEYEFAELRAQIKTIREDGIRLYTRDYHIERSEVEDDIEYLKKEESKFWKNVIDRRKPNLILPAI